MAYVPAADRYQRMLYRRAGRSGLKLPAISLGLWWNFGHDRPCGILQDFGVTVLCCTPTYALTIAKGPKRWG